MKTKKKTKTPAKKKKVTQTKSAVRKKVTKPRATKPKNVKPKAVVVKHERRPATVPLVVEPHPRDYTGLPFLTLIQYRKQPMLVVVDNADDESIRAFVLDLCGPEAVDEELIILTTAEWFQENRSNYPVSIEFSRRGLTPQTSRIYRSLNVEFVSRVIGPVPKFPMSTTKSVKRRRRKAVPVGVEIKREGNVLPLEQFFQ